MIKTILIFFIASVFEIAGCYLIWQWLRVQKSAVFGVGGVLLLTLYGVVATFHTSSFAKVYAAYGGIFILVSFFLAYIFDGYKLDKYDFIGMFFIALGISVIYFSPNR